MALSIVELLEKHGSIAQDELALAFANRMDPTRGYGRAAFEILAAIRDGESWKRKAPAVFQGAGSFGNGAAMRVAPLGAFFYDDLERVRIEARRSAEPTHAHEEGIAGAIAVAIAAALAARHGRGGLLDRDTFLASILDMTPSGYTKDGIQSALQLDPETDIVQAALKLGNGSGVTAPDTVPLCLFVAARSLMSFEDALWNIVAALGDRDTTCAIVGGIVALSSGGVPEGWLKAREPLPF
jgi:ADP-ribosylglycohydrolase